jgi:hypothetical protein
VHGEIEQELRDRQSRAGQARWADVNKRDRSAAMKRVRAGAKKN